MANDPALPNLAIASIRSVMRAERPSAPGAVRNEIPNEIPMYGGYCPLMRCRVVTKMSAKPSPPARVDPKYNVVPSHDSDGRVSPPGLLTVGPRLTGADHTPGLFPGVLTYRSHPARLPR